MEIEEIIKNASAWLADTFDPQTRKEVQQLIDNDPEELRERFYKNLEFGTGGMRGTMGAGTNKINKYTLGKNTQGISNYLKEQFPGEQLKVAIAYDCRHNSDTLAKVVAEVFSANGIKVYLFSDLRPTPELSFALKYLHCHCGIVLTASHNPPEYNGYKVYWQDGGQIVPPNDHQIIQHIDKLSFEDINFNSNEGLIEYIDNEIDQAFIKASVANAGFGAKNKDDFSIVFTPLHGTSITLLPAVLKSAGYNNVHIVESQAKPDGDFPTVASPNPEEPEALAMAITLADELNADMVIGTDPDGDRLGIAVRDHNGKMTLLNGNQTMILMTRFLLENWKKQGKINGNQYIASTIVSTPMMKVLADKYKVKYREALTGFKWIAKMIVDYPEEQFIGGGEESFGFMVGDFVRDKDAITAALLACEIAATAKSNGSSFYKELIDCYLDMGLYYEKLISLTKKGISGAHQIKQMMIQLRENPLKSIDGSKVIRIEDYANSTRLNVADSTTETMDIPKSNVLIYYTEDGSKIAARPSGTEPKIKFYFSVKGYLESAEQYHQAIGGLNQKIDRIIKELPLD